MGELSSRVQSLNVIVVTPVDPRPEGEPVNIRKSYEKNPQERTMYFLLIGLAGLALKYLEVEPVGAWSWWVVMAPFGLAVAWWAWADSTGYTKKKEMDKMDQRRKERIEKQRVAMGMLPKKRK